MKNRWKSLKKSFWKQTVFWHRFLWIFGSNLNAPAASQTLKNQCFFRTRAWQALRRPKKRPKSAKIGQKGAPRRSKSAKTRPKGNLREPTWVQKAPQGLHKTSPGTSPSQASNESHETHHSKFQGGDFQGRGPKRRPRALLGSILVGFGRVWGGVWEDFGAQNWRFSGFFCTCRLR